MARYDRDVFLLFASAVARGQTIVALPAGEDPTLWTGPLSLVGIVIGPAKDAVARIEVVGGGWRVGYLDPSGSWQQVRVDPPADRTHREELAFLLASWLEPVPTPSIPLLELDEPPVDPPRPRGVAPHPRAETTSPAPPVPHAAVPAPSVPTAVAPTPNAAPTVPAPPVPAAVAPTPNAAPTVPAPPVPTAVAPTPNAAPTVPAPPVPTAVAPTPNAAPTVPAPPVPTAVAPTPNAAPLAPTAGTSAPDGAGPPPRSDPEVASRDNDVGGVASGTSEAVSAPPPGLVAWTGTRRSWVPGVLTEAPSAPRIGGFAVLAPGLRMRSAVRSTASVTVLAGLTGRGRRTYLLLGGSLAPGTPLVPAEGGRALRALDLFGGLGGTVGRLDVGGIVGGSVRSFRDPYASPIGAGVPIAGIQIAQRIPVGPVSVRVGVDVGVDLVKTVLRAEGLTTTFSPVGGTLSVGVSTRR